MALNDFPITERSYSWEKRMSVVSRFMLLGNLRVVAEQENIAYDTLCEWKRSEWWPEMVDNIRRQKKQKSADSLTNIIENSLDTVKDRLENGDYVFNNKTGEVVRKPVTARDAATIANNLIQRQLQIEEFVDKNSHQTESVQEVLANVAKEFKKISNKLSKQSAETIEFIEVNNALHEEREARLQT